MRGGDEKAFGAALEKSVAQRLERRRCTPGVVMAIRGGGSFRSWKCAGFGPKLGNAGRISGSEPAQAPFPQPG